MTPWTLVAGALVLGAASLAAARWRRRAIPVVAASWAAVGAGLGDGLSDGMGWASSGSLTVLLAFAGALAGQVALRRILARAEQSSATARQRWARAERGARTGELAAALAHEIKNPLTPIRGYASLLLRELDAVRPAERATFEKGLGIIDAEAARIESRVVRALERARSAAPEPVNVAGLVEEVVGIAAVEAGVTRIDVDLAPGLPRVRAVEDGLQGALVNLVENAAEAMRDGPGPLRIEAGREGDYVWLAVRDRGPGFGEHDPEALTRAFFTTKETGTGLGLAVARSALESMGGELILRNRDDGPGAEATLRIPVWR
jgi:signal transduction histidine kinase